ncbi:MAG: type IV-A pilus assembly ATPase PilB [Candidatus Firestonebacteria bacterium RIFOXYC2_FULL_39_67]|nr:MAG: type IV-A pilus assembly ATPase PilB [Candidatus Firestonebacteria bacterium RIFOXYD2_FULL_39_29]OGF52813.1 MAG: type IV-A pilus assembly ATPase PilB [Candidatus Firestonebacteria bacterium RifOxyC12_full_39_7]OGF57440.1 MAG: type IV-A pilus assembly ATPase PilB [Candidatus Firestonebacteria bacterium RIFOXYC2_FULL_39_67]
MTVSMKKKLAQMLVDEEIITDAQLQESLKESKAQNIRLEQAIVKLGYITDDVIMAFMGTQMGIPTVNLSDQGDIDPNIVKLIPENVCQRQILVAIAKKGNNLTVAMSDPLNVSAIDDIRLMTGFEVTPVLASENEIKAMIQKMFSNTSAEMEEAMKDLENVEDVEVVAAEDEIDAAKLAAASEDAPIVKLVNAMLSRAIEEKASDIHLEIYEKITRMRYRIDGVLHERPAPPRKIYAALVSRIKIISELDIAERRKPQDGRCKIKVSGKEVDMRVSVLPTGFGEKVVIRVLDTTNLQLDLAQLGFEPDILQLYKKNVDAPYGMILVTGPTGSGKSVTLFSTLALLNYPDVNIVTIEDPIEFVTQGVNQVMVNNKAGLNFASGLKSFLRQDPDIILVGEIRDSETALIAINAALTGHLVLSTLHTNDAPQATTRLNNMGVEPFLITSSLIMVIAQRLVRKICPKCKEAYEVSPEVLEDLNIRPADGEKVVFYRGLGCPNCANTGYKGRAAIYEVMVMNDEIRKLILKRASGTDIKKIAIETGMITLREAGIRKVRAGGTSIEELLRTTSAD